MKFPYALLSDQHCHNWSQFASINEDGENTRLRIILDEMLRAAKELKEAGGDTMFFGGDLFHVRGAIDTEVLNATHACIRQIAEMGVSIYAIPGNHDLKGADSTELGNATQSLNAIKGVEVHAMPNTLLIRDDGGYILMFPWCSKVDDLRKELIKAQIEFSDEERAKVDVIIHAPVNGVLNIPDHGFAPEELAALGFRRVFAGHYHNHKTFCGGKVVSIGATTHHKWNDIDTKAGFLLVHEDRIEWRASHAPSFVEITDETDPDEMPLIADGNYVRVRGFKLDDAGVNTFRTEIMGWNAKGVTFQIERDVTAARTGTSSAKAKPLAKVVDEFIDRMDVTYADAVRKQTAAILEQAEALAD